jgi:hypothetical protein
MMTPHRHTRRLSGPLCAALLLTITSSAQANEPTPTEHTPTLSLLDQPLLLAGVAPDAPRAVELDAAGRLRLLADTMRDGVMTFFRVGPLHRETVAQVPLGLGEECLLISGDYISYNLLTHDDTQDQVVFGPYIQNWKSVRRQFDGHYGLRLLLPW